MINIVKVIPPEATLERKPEETVAYCATKHDPWKPLFIAWINPHDYYPTPTCAGYYDTLEDAEKALKDNPYGGYIEETTWSTFDEIII